MNNNAHLEDARYLLKEIKSAGPDSRKQILSEVREIIDYVMEEENA